MCSTVLGATSGKNPNSISPKFVWKTMRTDPTREPSSTSYENPGIENNPRETTTRNKITLTVAPLLLLSPSISSSRQKTLKREIHPLLTFLCSNVLVTSPDSTPTVHFQSNGLGCLSSSNFNGHDQLLSSSICKLPLLYGSLYLNSISLLPPAEGNPETLEMREEEVSRLPCASELSPCVLRFLGEKLKDEEDLKKSSDLELVLGRRCEDLEVALGDLGRQFSERIASYAVHSERIGGILGGVRTGIVELKECVSGSSLVGGGEEGGGRREQSLIEELPALAREVARVETVRAYAETALKLDSLIGDVEDAVSSTMAGKLRPSTAGSLEMRQMAISSLKKTEDILASVAKSRPQWTRLVLAVDNRVDRALAVLRPQAIAHHRSLLSSLGWPPALSSFINANNGKAVGPVNPLITMKGDLKDKYCESFLVLCNLQVFQRERKSRQLEGHNLEIALRQPLWAIEELVTPIALAAQRHFSKWIEKPDFIFALVYKITKDFVDSMDDILQPLVDKARLVGYSCREEWIAAIVTSLCTYLAKDVFPAYIAQLEEESSTSLPFQARISWLNLLDSMIAFDKRIQSLITDTGLLISVKEDDNMQRISSLFVFCDRPDWLDIWAEMELKDALDMLMSELENEKNWIMKTEGTSSISDTEKYKSPPISSIILQTVSSLVGRSRPLPNITLRSRFIKLAGAPILREYLDILLRRCQEAEGLTALADDDALFKVCNSINTARYSESVLMEWSEDVFFLEMASNSDDNGESFVLEEEIHKLKEFRKGWLEKLSAVILRGFDARCREYLKNKKQWQEKEDSGNVSKSFIDALDHLQSKTSKMQERLNEVDFVGLWRSLAGGADQLLFGGTLGSNSKFCNGGVKRYRGDLEVLLRVFKAWCLRPDGFFPKLSEGLSLLKMEEKELKEALMEGKEKWLRKKGLQQLTLIEAEKIAKNRIFSG